MNYRDVIDRMERRGDYSAAHDYRDALHEHGHSEHDRVDRYNPADGAQYSHAGNCAEEAYRDLQRDERRAEERREEEERERYEQEQRWRQAEEPEQEPEMVETI